METNRKNLTGGYLIPRCFAYQLYHRFWKIKHKEKYKTSKPYRGNRMNYGVVKLFQKWEMTPFVITGPKYTEDVKCLSNVMDIDGEITFCLPDIFGQ